MSSPVFLTSGFPNWIGFRVLTLLLMLAWTQDLWAQPMAPDDIRTWGLTLTRTKVSWRDRAGDESEYRVERSENGGAFAEVATRPANSTSYDDMAVNAANTYLSA